LPPVRFCHSDGREASAVIPRTDRHRAESDVPDYDTPDLGDQRHAEAARSTKQIDQPGLVCGRETRGVDSVDRRHITGLFGPNHHSITSFLPDGCLIEPTPKPAHGSLHFSRVWQ
jgi:hypothetical protein